MGIKKTIPFLSVFLIFFIGVFISYRLLDLPKKLKIFNPSDVSPELVDSSIRTIPRNHHIADFELINQDGKIISQKDFTGKIYVAEFFFTTCRTICPKMNSLLQKVNEKFKEDDRVMFLSHTVMPERDSVPVLADYAKRFGADSKKWMFVTGEKKKIYELARKSYFAVKLEENFIKGGLPGDEKDFIHTENFVLVDKNKRIRGFYDGTSEKDIDRLIQEIQILLLE